MLNNIIDIIRFIYRFKQKQLLIIIYISYVNIYNSYPIIIRDLFKITARVKYIK